MALIQHCDLCQAVIPDGTTPGQVTIKKNQKSNVGDADLETCADCTARLLGELAEARHTLVPVVSQEATA